MKDTIYSKITIINLAGKLIFSANAVTVQDALNGYAATYDTLSTDLLIGNIGEIRLES